MRFEDPAAPGQDEAGCATVAIPPCPLFIAAERSRLEEMILVDGWLMIEPLPDFAWNAFGEFHRNKGVIVSRYRTIGNDDRLISCQLTP